MAVLSVSLIIVSGLACNRPANTEKNDRVVRAEAISQTAAEGKVEALPGFEVEIGSEIDGRIVEMTVEEGSVVRKGDLLAKIESRELQAKLKEAEAALSGAKAKLQEVVSGSRQEEIRAAAAELSSAIASAEFERGNLPRYRNLYNKGIIAKEGLDEKEMQRKTAEERVKKASENLLLLEKGPKPETVKLYTDAVVQADASAEYFRRLVEKASITAPISGKVVRKYVNRGEMVNKDFQPLILAVADIEKIRINAEVDETDIGKIKLGDPAEVSCYAYPGRVFRGVVQEIADYAGARKVKPNNPVRNLDMKIIQVKIALTDKTPLKTGMTVDVKITPKDRASGQ